jgi:hypothetical protein
MAADADGRVYILDQASGGTPGLWAVHKIEPDGSISQNHASGIGNAGQLAYRPDDGSVCMVHYPGILGAGSSDIISLDPAGGTTLLTVIDIEATGFTIDDGARPWFLSGGGLYRMADLSSTSPTLMTPNAYGSNLLALGTTDILLQSGGNVFRWNATVGSGPPLHWDTLNVNPSSMSGHGIARSPFNRFGIGAVFMRREGLSMCYICLALANYRNVLGGEATSIVIASYWGGGTSPPTYIGRIAGGQHRDLYWMDGVLGGTLSLERIVEEPQAGEPGSLIVTSLLGQLAFEWGGRAGAPINFGVMSDPLPASAMGLLLPIGGVVDLYPLHPGYLPLADGAGAFGPPDPLAVLDPGGTAHYSFALPPIPVPLHFLAQHLTFTTRSPNGVLQIGPVVPFTIN